LIACYSRSQVILFDCTSKLVAGRTENYGTGAYVPDWMSITYTGLAISFEIVCLAFWEYIYLHLMLW